MQFVYVVVLLVANAGLLLADRQFKLGIYGRSFVGYVVVPIICFFLFFDLLGVSLDIFSTNPSFVLPFNRWPDSLPLEEVLFLHLLIMSTAVGSHVVRRN